MLQVCARRTRASYTARLPCGWYLPMTSPTMRAHLGHRKKNAAMHRLQSVADIGQRAADDHRHGIVEIRPLHLLFNVDGLNIQRAGTVAAGRRSEGKFRVLIVWHGLALSL